ncbi:DUF2513 domain-containing protein [Rhodobacter capsulatus]|uniref:DUF2513 domain-containing protein n=1 Tax=Rhodobacter capsulatus TaxID=1061 RepID=UPI00402A1C2E
MKRDKNLIRDLLLKIEASDTPDGLRFDSRFAPYVGRGAILLEAVEAKPELRSRDYQLLLMKQSGLIEFVGKDHPIDFHGGRVRLTPAGHDAVEAISDDEIWRRLREAAPKEAYEIIKDVGSSVAVAALTTLMGWG